VKWPAAPEFPSAMVMVRIRLINIEYLAVMGVFLLTFIYDNPRSTTKDILSVPQIVEYIPLFGVWSVVNPFSADVE
jgi:hypothetical protein